MSMCVPCARAHQGWLDYRVVQPVGLMSIGNDEAHVRAAQTIRFQEWSDTVRFHQDLIVRLCAEGRHIVWEEGR